MTEQEIFEGMLETFQQETGYEMTANADLAVRLRAAAAQIMGLYGYGDYVYRQAFPQTAEGEELERHGVQRGVSRIPGEKAQGTLVFGMSSGIAVNLTIPEGTVCLTREGVAFETLEEGILTAGNVSVEIPAQAMEEGSQGNVLSRVVVRMQTPPDGIEWVTNEEAFSGGRAPEEDEAYRKRILDAYMGLSNGTNIAYYSQVALSVPGIHRVKVVPCIDGGGTVGIYVSSDDGVISEETLELLQAQFASRTELGITVNISAPEAVDVAISAKILPAKGYTLAVAKAAVEQALQACFLGDRMGKTLYLSQLSHKAMETGAIDNIVFTLPASDVTINGDQQPVLTTITLGGM